MSGNSKNKGNRGEREVCKFWKEWTNYEFSRTPASGGLRWKKADNISSDVICTDDKHFRKFPFSIESKFYKDIRFEHILLGNKKCKILEFWDQANNDSIRAGKLPVLMMRYNNMPKGEFFFIVDNKVSKIINGYNKLLELPIMVVVVNKNITLNVYMASDILKLPYKEIYKKVRKLLKIR